MLKEHIQELLKDLLPREAEVLKLRYGSEDGQVRTLEQVGKVFNITRERVRQIENKAFEKLQKHMLNSAKSKNLLPAN